LAVKRALIITPVVVVLVGGGLLAAPGFVDWNQYKAEAMAQAKALTGLGVEINGDVSVAILPTPRIYLQDVVVRGPADPADKPVVSLRMLDVRVSLLSLLAGKVVVNSFNLDTPQVRLVKGADGRFNYQTPEIDALMAAKEDGASTQSVAVAFENISIESGLLVYKDAASAPVELKDLDLALQAGTLAGPFDVNGSVNYGGQPVTFSAKTGQIDPQTQSTSLNFQGDLSGLALKYAGVVTLGDAPEAQGEITVAADSLGDVLAKNGVPAGPLLAGSFEAHGVLSATRDKAALKNATLVLAGQTLNGELEAGFSPLSLVGTLRSENPVDLDKILAQQGTFSSASAAAGGDLTDLASALPRRLELPVLGPVKVEIAMPAAVYSKQILRDVTLRLSKQEKGFGLDFAAGEMPGGLTIQAGAVLAYAEKTASAGAEVYTGPSASFSLKGKAQNAPEAFNAFTGMNAVPVLRSAKTALFDISGRVVQNGFDLEKGLLNLDDKAFSVTGSLKKPKDAARSQAKISVVADTLDFDELSGGKGKVASSAPAGSADMFAPLKTLALPYDLSADLSVARATLQGQPVEGLRAAVSILPNTLILDEVGARNFAGSSFSVKGRIGDLKALSGLDLTAGLNSPDPYKLATTLKMDPASLPKNLGTVKVNANLQGSLQAVKANADIGALGGSLTFKGDIANPLSSPVPSGVVIQVKHPNLANAMGNLGMTAPDYKSLSGPVDFYAKVDQSGKVTSLSGIKATLAGTSMAGDLKYDTSGAVPYAGGSLKFGKLVLQSAKAAVNRTGSTEEIRPTASGGKWSSTAIDTQFLRSMNADFDVSADGLLYETWDMKSPALKLSLKDGVLDISDLKAGLFDGDLALQGKIAAPAAEKPLAVSFSSKIANINMGALATALSGTSRMQAEGDVSLDFNVDGAGRSESDIVNSLKGGATLAGRNVVMKGFDLAGLATALMDSSKPLDRLQQVVGASTSGGQTQFDTVNGRYTIAAGVVNIDSMSMDGSAATIASTGNASLPRWYLDTVHTITLKNAREVQPFKVSIQGPLDNPLNTFSKGMFDTLLREKVKGQVMEKLPGLLGDKTTGKLQQLGILPQQKTETPAPAAETTPQDAQQNPSAAPAPETPPQGSLKDQAIQGLIKGLLR
jgi:uncharacterized protein involved in outer membrane biogenesis